MGASLLMAQIGHLVVAMAFGVAVFVVYRWIRRRSRALGAIVAATILLRLTVGLALFWASYLALPVISSLQDYGGFWTIAADATGYHQLAAAAAESGALYPLDHAVPAPFYIDTLAIWMMAVGISPAAGMFLNICLYVGLAAMMVRAFDPVNDWRRDLPLLVGLGAYSFSPVVMMHATQPLKEELFGLTVALATLGILPLRRLITGAVAGRRHEWLAGAAVIAAAIFAAAGIRWYYGCVLIGSLGLLLTLFAVWGRTTSLSRYLARSAAVLVAAWIAFWGGAGPMYQQVAPGLFRISDVPSQLINMTQIARVGFLRSGGNTNIVVALRDDPAVGLAQADLLRQREIAAERLRDREQLDRLEREQRRIADAVGREALRRERELAASQRAAAERARLAREAAERAEAARRAAARRRQQGGGGDDATTMPATETPPLPRAEAPTPVPAAPERPRQTAAPVSLDAFRAVPTNLREHLATAGSGIALVFAPTTVVRPLLGIDVPGGRGLLSLVDLDTYYTDLTLLAVFWLLWTRRSAIGDRLPLVVFSVVLSGTTAVLLGYVVTNFGTLWRMRPLVAIPLWIAVVALSPAAREPREDAAPAVPLASTPPGGRG